VLPLRGAFRRPGHLDYRYQQARSIESGWSNSVAESSPVEQDESDGCCSDHFRKPGSPDAQHAPRALQKFSGVVKWLQDERHFIYALNGDGSAVAGPVRL
jgi:hypothetical protein